MKTSQLHQKKITSWYSAIAFILFSLWLGINFIYFMGADGVRFSRGSGAISFDRQHDAVLLKVDDQAAISVSQDFLSFVNYQKGSIPFCWICGKFQSAGTIVNGVTHRQGSWYYVEDPIKEAYGYHAYNTSTREKFRVENYQSGELPIEYAQRGLVIDEAHRFNLIEASKELTPLSTMKESCIIFNMAFFILAGIWCLVGVTQFFFRKRSAQYLEM